MFYMANFSKRHSLINFCQEGTLPDVCANSDFGFVNAVEYGRRGVRCQLHDRSKWTPKCYRAKYVSPENDVDLSGTASLASLGQA